MCAWFGTTKSGLKAKRAVHSKRRQLREQAATPADNEGIDRLAIYDIRNGLCNICGLPVPIDDFELDHVIPLTANGSHTADNLAPAHPSCNASKGNRTGPKKKGLRSGGFRRKRAKTKPPDDGEMF